MFGSKKKCTRNLDNLVINGSKINKLESTAFLGVHIESNLTWSVHINYIQRKIAKGLGILGKARKYFSQSTLVTLYYTFIYPYLTYCVEVWGNANNIYISSLFKLQKKQYV